MGWILQQYRSFSTARQFQGSENKIMFNRGAVDLHSQNEMTIRNSDTSINEYIGLDLLLTRLFDCSNEFKFLVYLCTSKWFYT